MSKIISHISSVVNLQDTDANAHMNNAAYPWHFEQGRRDLFEKSKLDPLSLEPRAISLFVRSSIYRYHKPAKERDEVAIETSFGGIEDKFFVVTNQRMFLRDECVATSKTRYVFVDLKTKAHILPPVDLVEKIV
jgi:YbgC/YbaW family acyl-CoA thioester hydrolase